MAATAKVVAIQPVRSGDTTYLPGQELILDAAAAKQLVAKGYARIAPKPTKPETPAVDKAEKKTTKEE